MRHILRLNRQDIVNFTRGEPLDFRLGDELITWEFETPTRARATNGAHPDSPPPLAHTKKKNGTRRMHSPAFKRAAVTRYLRGKTNGKETGQDIADDLKISRGLLTAWAEKLGGDTKAKA